MPTLYIVATPIGNLMDITLRALEVLKSVDIIACEDTRHTLKLLNAYEIRKPLVSCNAHKERKGDITVIPHLLQGKDVAYVTDAGTPGLSDPGSIVVSRVREQGFPVVPIPGPSALSALVSVFGHAHKNVFFEGFLPRKGGKRKKRLEELIREEDAIFLFESPFRVLKLLADITSINPEIHVLMGREMTKKHEEYLEGSAQEIFDHLEKKTKIQGEFSFLVSGKKKR